MDFTTYEPVEMPQISGLVGHVVRGRVPLDGYARGWGLQFGELSERVENDPLYRHALEPVMGRTIQADNKRKNIFLLMTNYLSRLSSQDVVEFGSYRGGSAIFMAMVAKALYPSAKVYALDTFEGMPVTDKTIDAHSQGDFADVDLDEMRMAAEALGLDNLIFVKGLFNDTFPQIAREGVQFGMAHIDCDIYEAVRYSQDAVWPTMAAGGYVVYDDAEISSCIGATQAVEELVMDKRVHSEQVYPHFVFRAGL